jgi:hypothetical protein
LEESLAARDHIRILAGLSLANTLSSTVGLNDGVFIVRILHQRMVPVARI